MKAFIQHLIEELTNAGVLSVSVGDLDDRPELPRFIQWQYHLFELIVNDEEWIGVRPRDATKLQPLQYEKHATIIGERLSARVCLVAESLPFYIRQRLVSSTLPFIVPGVQMYWPELGLLLRRRVRNATSVRVERLSPLTQLLAIHLLLGRIDRALTVSELAERLGCTSMSMSRALTELSGRDLATVTRQGRDRLLHPVEDRPGLWRNVGPLMRDPVRHIVAMHERDVLATARLLAGESALAALTDLNPPSQPVYAIAPATWKEMQTEKARRLSVEEPDCVVQRWWYDPSTVAINGVVDPFSLFLSLQSVTDERLESARDSLIERYAWS